MICDPHRVTAPTDHFTPHSSPLTVGVKLLSTQRYQTKVVFPGNRATRSTISSAGWPPCCHLHAWTAVNDRQAPSRFCQSRNAYPPACSNKHLCTQLSPCLLYEYSLVSLVFNYLSQYGRIKAQHMSQMITCSWYYYRREAVVISDGLENDTANLQAGK